MIPTRKWNVILGLFWPPFGRYLKQRAFDAWSREQDAKWHKEVYIPWRKRENLRLLNKANNPIFAAQFMAPKFELRDSVNDTN